MSFLPDPAALTAVAERITGHAAAGRHRATALAAAVAAAHWHGLAAEAFETQAAVVVVALRESADRLDAAADALRRHAGQVGALLDTLRTLGPDAVGALTDLVTDPARLLDDGGRLLRDAATVGGTVGGAVSGVATGALHVVGLG